MALASAVATGDLRLIRGALSMGCDLNAVNNDGDSALMLAANGNNVGVSDDAVSDDAAVGGWGRHAALANSYRVTPLLLASEHGFSNLIKILVNTTSNDGTNVLATAAQAGHVETVKMLIDSGVYVDLDSGEGRTPLMFAAGKGQAEVVKLLLDKGADPNKGPRYGKTALNAAAEGGHVEVVQVLLTHGTSVKGCDHCPEMTPLAGAAQHGHVEIIKLLLQNHAETNAHDDDGDSALHETVYHGHLEAARALVEAEPGANVNKRNRCGWTPLMAAAHRDLLAFVELFV
ncbi:hypothetical protein V7S43_007300 [Phytophthora oleae]|uniref:Uncharacterized protein n=1 Tax=Phytophthora oleae TaxID=2107226 RepID=A0ABD3FPH4_9STRA